MSFCTKCGKKLRTGSKFCTFCGARIRSTSTSEKTYSSPSKTIPQKKYSVSIPPKKKIAEKIPEKLDTEDFTISSEELLNDERLTPSSRDFETEFAAEKQLETSTPITQKPSETFYSFGNKENKVEKIESDNGLNIEDSEPTEKIDELDTTKAVKSVITSSLGSISQSKWEKGSEEVQSVSDIIKEKIKDMKYNYNTIEWREEYIAVTTFISGAFEEVIWNFVDNFIITGKLKDENDIEFALSLPTKRGSYDWKNPYGNFEINTSQPEVEKRLRRESRLAEKLAKISGNIKLSVKGSNVELLIDKEPNNLQPTLDVIKELSWIMGMSFRF